MIFLTRWWFETYITRHVGYVEYAARLKTKTYINLKPKVEFQIVIQVANRTRIFEQNLNSCGLILAHGFINEKCGYCRTLR
jgi:hypothetical protein